jgi:hypothetical protein
MSNTELENAKVSEAQPGAKDRQTERRSLSAKAKSRQSKRSSTRRPPDASRCGSRRHAAGGGTKQNLVLQMLQRQSGVGIDEIAAKTGWQTHSVRSFLSAVVRKKQQKF